MNTILWILGGLLVFKFLFDKVGEWDLGTLILGVIGICVIIWALTALIPWIWNNFGTLWLTIGPLVSFGIFVLVVLGLIYVLKIIFRR